MIGRSQNAGWCCFSRTLLPPLDRTILRQVVASIHNGMILESIPGSMGRFSIFGVSPKVEFDPGASDPFVAMAGLIPNLGTAAGDGSLPIYGGWIGYLPYEAGGFVEPHGMTRHTSGSFAMGRWVFHDALLLHDARDDQWHATVIARGPEAESEGLRRLDSLERQVGRFSADADDSHSWHREQKSKPVWNMTTDEYVRRVVRAKEYIAAGDVFQVNVARQCRLRRPGRHVDLYEQLCRKNPAAYAAYIPLADGNAVLSSSPELFLAMEGREVVTRPIKGTRPRTGDPAMDNHAVAELESSEKDRAELNMIIDLERNDLGRVCEFGSIEVISAGAIETHPTVFHRTATVRGRLRNGISVVDVLRATFPGGSITGAPKVRAMQIIEELEPEARGPYCGAIGYVGVNGDAQFNLPIRTMWTEGADVRLAVGSGIVADSDPEAEFLETAAKARGMLAALGMEESLDESGAAALAGRER